MHLRLKSDARAFRFRALTGQFAALLVLPLSIATALGGPSDPRETLHVVQSASIDKPVTGQQVLSKLVKYNHYKETHLLQYSVLQSYVVKNAKGRSLAETVVRMQYRAPGVKTFTMQFARGSRLIRQLVFKPLMEQEVQTAAGRGRQVSAIGPGNHAFELLGEEQIDPYHCFVVRAVPRRRDKYLFEGKIWINAEDFGIVKITGHPAKTPSFWMKQVNFVRGYQRVERFWLPSRDNAVADIRFFGRKTLTIDYAHYNLSDLR